ncbi:MAG: AurF N-oxygenase family protein [Acidimicrobiales bacterium]
MTVTDPHHPSLEPVDDEVTVAAAVVADDDAFVRLVQRLSRQSVDKHYDAYADIPWDDPAYAIDPDDPRFELGTDDPLGRTEWYRAQPQGVRAQIGLYRYVSAMKIGLQFENILTRGLLEHTFDLPNGDPTFRYAYHEVIEEAHHGLMFQEFVNRSPFDTPGLRWDMRFGAARIVKLGHRFPELFFMFVLGGEDPIDHVQREALRSADAKHPLVEIIMRHHVTEEARHLSFARHYLKRTVPRLGLVKRQVLGLLTPVILGTMAQIMMQAPSDLIARFDIPAEVVRAAYVDDPDHRAQTVVALRKVRRLARELGIVTPVSRPVWKALGIWDDDLADQPARA